MSNNEDVPMDDSELTNQDSLIRNSNDRVQSNQELPSQSLANQKSEQVDGQPTVGCLNSADQKSNHRETGLDPSDHIPKAEPSIRRSVDHDSSAAIPIPLSRSISCFAEFTSF